MCHCGDYYCVLSHEARLWANAEHDRLINSEEWVKRYPDPVIRDLSLALSLTRQADQLFKSSTDVGMLTDAMTRETDWYQGPTGAARAMEEPLEFWRQLRLILFWVAATLLVLMAVMKFVEVVK